MVWFWFPLSEEARFIRSLWRAKLRNIRHPCRISSGVRRARAYGLTSMLRQDFFLLELALCALSSCYAKRSTVLCLLSKYVLELQRKQSLVHVHTNNNVLTQETTEWAPCQVDQIGAKAGLLTLENTGQSQQNVTQHGYSYMKASWAPLLIWFNTISRSMITILFFSEMVDYANAAMVRWLVSLGMFHLEACA